MGFFSPVPMRWLDLALIFGSSLSISRCCLLISTGLHLHLHLQWLFFFFFFFSFHLLLNVYYWHVWSGFCTFETGRRSVLLSLAWEGRKFEAHNEGILYGLGVISAFGGHWRWYWAVSGKGRCIRVRQRLVSRICDFEFDMDMGMILLFCLTYFPWISMATIRTHCPYTGSWSTTLEPLGLGIHMDRNLSSYRDGYLLTT